MQRCNSTKDAAGKSPLKTLCATANLQPMLEDRPYMRNVDFGARRWIATATAFLLLLNLAVFIFLEINKAYLGWPILPYLALSNGGLAHGYIWQLITFQFL